MKVEDLHRLERAERAMVRWMCGVTLKNRTRSDELMERLGVESITDVIRRGRLRWFGHFHLNLLLGTQGGEGLGFSM